MNRAERRTIREGEKAFDACNVRIVAIQDYSYPPEVKLKRGELVIPEDIKAIEQSKKASDTSGFVYGGSLAKLRCPVTEDTGIRLASHCNNHDGSIRAYNSLRKIAGVLACRTCQYSGKTPAQVATERTEFALAEADRLRAYAAMHEAQAQVADINRAITGQNE